MSTAIKCDRCKKCFDPWNAKGLFAHIDVYKEQTAENYKNNEVSYRDDDLDLCPECAKYFAHFMSTATPMVDQKMYDDLQQDYDRLSLNCDKFRDMYKELNEEIENVSHKNFVKSLQLVDARLAARKYVEYVASWDRDKREKGVHMSGEEIQKFVVEASGQAKG